MLSFPDAARPLQSFFPFCLSYSSLIWSIGVRGFKPKSLSGTQYLFFPPRIIILSSKGRTSVSITALFHSEGSTSSIEIETASCGHPHVSNGILYITFPQVSTTKTIINDYDPGKETIISSTGLLPEEPSPPSCSASKPCAFHPKIERPKRVSLYLISYNGMFYSFLFTGTQIALW